MKIVKKKISDLKPAEYNPRRMTEKQKQDIRNSLTEFGLVVPQVAYEIFSAIGAVSRHGA